MKPKYILIMILGILDHITANKATEGGDAKEDFMYVLEDDVKGQSILVDANYATKEQREKQQLEEEEQRIKDAPPRCRHDLPTLSVSDVFVTAENWPEFKKNNKVFVLSVSDSQCPTCCQDEPLLLFLQQAAQVEKAYLFKGKPIPIARLDLADQKARKILENEGLALNEPPVIYIGFDQKLYQHHDATADFGGFLHHLNRIIDPLPLLQADDDVESFFDTADATVWPGDWKGPLFRNVSVSFIPALETYNDYRLKTRVVCFFFDKSEYKDEIKKLRQAARGLAHRGNLRLAYVTKPTLIKRLKRKHSAKYFPDLGYSSCALRRYDGQYKVLDVAGATHALDYWSWVNHSSKKPVDLLDNEAIQVQQSIGTSMFVAFVDFEDKNYAKASQAAVGVLNAIQPRYGHLFGFYYAENKKWGHLKRVLGITWDELPALAFNMLDQTIIPYPQSKSIDEETVTQWFDGIVTRADPETANFREAHRVVKDSQIYSMSLADTIITDRTNFTQYALEETYDTLALLYTTEALDEAQRQTAKEFNKVSDLVHNQHLLNLGSKVRIICYDANVNGFPQGIEYQALEKMPVVYFFPAFSKSPPHQQYTGSKDALNYLRFLQKMSRNKTSQHQGKSLQHSAFVDDKELLRYLRIYSTFKDQGKSLAGVEEEFQKPFVLEQKRIQEAYEESVRLTDDL